MNDSPSDFEILTNPTEIESAQRQLESELQTAATWTGRNKIGSRAGNVDAELHWFEVEQVWYASPPRDLNRWSNGFGEVDPRLRPTLNTTVWINPSKDASGQSSARFLRDSAGNLFLAHTGKIGGGKKGVGQRALLESLDDTFKRAVVGGQHFVVVGQIGASTLVASLARYVKAVAGFKAAIDAGDEDESDGDGDQAENEESVANARWSLDTLLSNYDVPDRKVILDWIAHVVRHAQAQGPNCWVMTRRGEQLRINVGRNVAFGLRPPRIVVLGLHLPSYVGDPAEIAAATQSKELPFVDVPDSVLRRITVDTFVAHHEALHVASDRFIEGSAKAFTNTPFARYHAPDLLESVERLLGTELPRPTHRAKVRRVPRASGPSGAGDRFDQILDAIAAEGLHFPSDVVACYLLALQAKRFVILSGISGTGKTELARMVATALQPPEVQAPARTTDDAFDGQRMVVRPYMLKYSRIAIPAAFATRVGIEGTVDLKVRYGGDQVETLRWSSDPRYLYFKKPITAWFRSTFTEGDELLLSLDEDADELPILRIEPSTPAAAPPPEKTYEIIAVRPDWTDNRGLLGYYNPITRNYHSTAFLRLLLRARAEAELATRQGRRPQPYFVVLDEMNLARVEHYFSDFLSSLESREPLHLHDILEIEEGDGGGEAVPRQLAIPSNLYFTGTVNVDETTYMFSPKVLDRSFVLEFNEVDLHGMGRERDPVEGVLSLDHFVGLTAISVADALASFRAALDGELFGAMDRLHERLELDHRHFGYRVAKEIASFVALASQQAGDEPDTLWHAFDMAVLAKVLPKLHGTQQELGELLARLLAFAVDVESPTVAKADENAFDYASGVLSPKTGEAPALPYSAAKLWRMLRRVRLQGYVSFIE